MQALDQIADAFEKIFADRPDVLPEVRMLVDEMDVQGWLDDLDDFDARATAGFILLAVMDRGAGYLEALALVLRCEPVPTQFASLRSPAKVADAVELAASSGVLS